MRENTVRIKFKDKPVLLDKVLQDIQKALKDKLPWLDYAFGKSYKMVEHRSDGEKFIYPAAYNGNGEYVSLLPNDNYGNFSWFDIYDPQDIVDNIQSRPQFTFSGALVFWYDLSSIYEDKSVIYSEEIKDEIVRLLTTPGFIKTNSKLTIDRIYERPENIYKDYAIEKIYNNYSYKGEGIQSIDKQFFVYPYSGLRIEFTLTTRELCQHYIK